MASRLSLRRAAALAPVIAFLAVYVPRVGHGFIADDYRWVLESRVSSVADALALFTHNNGFYRPVVSLTFAADHWLFGIDPLGYGLTNLALAVVCAGLICRLARALEMPWGAATLAGSIWLLNFHGINMSVLWISGRTALLLTLAAVAAATCIVRRHLLAAAAWTAVALLAKEEAVLLPGILAAWLYLYPSSDTLGKGRALWRWLVYAALLTAGYVVLRHHSGAMTPATAPAYYRFTFSAGAVARNVLEYGDRTFSFPLIVTGLAWLCLRWRQRGPDRVTPPRPALIMCAALWIVGAYALTVFLPVRSSLYACWPLVGASLIAAEWCRGFWQVAPAAARGRALRLALLCVLIAAPIHFSRTGRFVAQAEVSQAAWVELPRLTYSVPDGATVVIYDDMTRRANMRAAFGSLAGSAYELLTGRHLNFWLEPSLGNGETPPCSSCVTKRLAFRRGHLVSLSDGG
ncbi:MAG TPA: hypothetical protein VG538_18405 [Vicinamibacterales bacterium]|jgi:hypothetical protein|nr:hypothetical protein [Vicinamibacterales bacterium]